jgi:hypothetical protein
VSVTLLQPATKNSEEGQTKQRTKDQETKNKKTESSMNNSASHTCSGTINSSMYDSDFSITTFPLTSSAPYCGYRPVKTLTCILSFCCKSGSNGMTQKNNGKTKKQKNITG